MRTPTPGLRNIPATQTTSGTRPVTVTQTQTVVTRRRIPVAIPIFGQVPVTVPQTGLTITSGAIPVLVRGDITYLRQDFSVQLLVSRPLPARPLRVRFDYLVRAIRIPSLKGPFQKKARAVLVERLSRMTAKTLRDKLADDDPEVRRAAVQACQRKEKKELVPELIGLLADSDPLTARTAEAALRDMTGQEHETAEAWQEWWEEQ